MLRRLITFLKARDGLAAIEFAFIAPLLVTLLLGTVEVSNALEAHQKVTSLASSAADLVAQTTSVSTDDVKNVFNAVTAIMYPFEGTTSIVISSVASDGNGGGTVLWSLAQNATPLTKGTKVALSQAIMLTCTSTPTASCKNCAAGACTVIMATTGYAYTSPVGKFLVSTINMTDSFFARPRKSTSVTCTDCT